MRESTERGRDTKNIMFTHTDFKEIEMVGYFWQIHKVINGISLNLLEEFFGERRDGVRISQNPTSEKQSQNNLIFPFHCAIILLAAWYTLCSHKLCVKQFSPQKPSYLSSIMFCMFICNFC